MTCHDTRPLLDGYLDGELDLLKNLELEQHLAECHDCTRLYQSHRALGLAVRSDALYYRAPAGLDRRIHQALRKSAPSKAGFERRWLGVAASIAVLAVAGWGLRPLLFRSVADQRIVEELVASHVRSLMANHLADVPSSDQHTVKPWFTGKLDFSPPVTDFSAQGFPLVGGRLDYLDGRPAAAVVYRRRQHLINLFTWPEPRAADSPAKALTRQGYHMVHFTRTGMHYWLVSDLNEKELKELAGLLAKPQ
jgi:anti-sigma factor RsiW